MTAVSQAASVAVRFATEVNAGSANYTQITTNAGAVLQNNWNNIDLPRGNGLAPGTLATVVDDSGATVPGLSLSYDASAAYINGTVGSGDDVTLLSGGMESQTATYGAGNQISLTGVPYAQYDLYVYVNGWTANRTGKAQLNGGSEITFNTYQNFPGSHNESPNNTVQGTYILWSGVSGDPTIQFANGNTNIMIGGIQLVQVPEPGTISLIGLAGFGLMLRRRKYDCRLLSAPHRITRNLQILRIPPSA